MRSRLLMILVAVMLALLPAASAQDGLTEEEQALLDRVLAALQKVETYNSFQSSIEMTESQNLSISLLGQNQVQSSSTVTQIEATVIDVNGDNPNVTGTAVATVNEAQDQVTTSYGIEAEFRFVDGVLYVNAAYGEGAAGPLSLPEGWVTVDDLGMAGLEPLALDEVVGDLMDEEGDEDDNLLEKIQEIAEAATSVALTQEDMNGTPVDVVTITFDWAGIRDVLAGDARLDESNPFFAIFEQVQGDIASISLMLNENDEVVGYRFDFGVVLADLDLSQFTDEVPAGTMISIDFSQGQLSTLSDINGTFEPITAPETN